MVDSLGIEWVRLYSNLYTHIDEQLVGQDIEEWKKNKFST